MIGLEELASWLVPICTIAMVVGVQLMFWLPAPKPIIEEEPATTEKDASQKKNVPMRDDGKLKSFPRKMDFTKNGAAVTCIVVPTASTEGSNSTKDENGPEKKNDRMKNDIDMNDFYQTNDQWRCSCEGGFLPPGLLKSFGRAEAVMRLGTGQCYHKNI